MTYRAEHIIKVLKAARLAKGLSQRDLSTRTGVPQSHISKIENGATDIRVSSLVEIARAIDLDLKLVPRKAVPAVDSIVRSTSPDPANPATVRELRHLSDQAEAMRKAFPDEKAIKQIQQSLVNLRPLSINADALAAIRDASRHFKDLQNFIRENPQITESAKTVPAIPASTVRAIAQSANALAAIRNTLAHDERQNAPRPAYQLDDDEEDRDG